MPNQRERLIRVHIPLLATLGWLAFVGTYAQLVQAQVIAPPSDVALSQFYLDLMRWGIGLAVLIFGGLATVYWRSTAYADKCVADLKSTLEDLVEMKPTVAILAARLPELTADVRSLKDQANNLSAAMQRYIVIEEERARRHRGEGARP